ncbi:GNAT family N-acetyltransferase [Pontivivens ytuae]|uniref:GNAT family N-acetyltransferase n=1 Tax=Pontivivens ytuae TaxID=2789856 RepID=A0A7S9QBG3_9RHOB|nr:GNAT family N-acetyltransferase [Pontivivens ytuae]QPH53133.1 GNAT family N-acetyltransferase [Pontivivens ytuae]
MADRLTIRPLAPADEPAWRDLWRAYLAFYETERPEEVYATYWQRLLGDDPHDYHGLIALDGDRPVGLVHYLFHRHGWRIEDVCYLQDLYVAPEARGTGAGRALIEAVYAAADAAGAPAVYWTTQEGNATARQLYDRIARNTGFIKYER